MMALQCKRCKADIPKGHDVYIFSERRCLGMTICKECLFDVYDWLDCQLSSPKGYKSKPYEVECQTCKRKNDSDSTKCYWCGGVP
jgi:hypothetical protein